MPTATLNRTLRDLTTVLTVSTPLTHTPKIHNLTGRVLWNGSAILCFVGPPNRTVLWQIVQGSGTIFPFTDYTDKLGRASARFDAGGIEGSVVVAVEYVP